MSIIARLSAVLSANTASFETNMKKASNTTGAFSSNFTRSMAGNTRSLSSFSSQISVTQRAIGNFKSELAGLVGVAASAFSVGKITRYSDEYKSLSARLKIAVGDSRDFLKVQEDLFEIAKENFSPVVDLVDAYSKLSLATNDAQKSQIDLTRVTELLSKTLLISGTNAAGAQTFYQQFGQAASSDFKAIGQEIQTFQDQNAFFAGVLKRNLDTGGQSLKDFAADGKLSFDLVAQALLNAGEEIDKTASQIPITVGRALQNLDTAFLKIIGQSEAVKRGTSSVALGIQTLADNLGGLAKAAGVLAGVLTARLVSSLVASSGAFLAATAQSLAYQATLARMAGLSLAAAAGVTTLGASLTGLAGALALVGGPIGIAVITAVALFATSSNKAADAQGVLNQEMANFQSAAAQYMFASDEVRKQIEQDAADRIKAYRAELIAVQALTFAYQQENVIFRKARELGSAIGVDTSAKDMEQLAQNIRTQIEALEAAQKSFEDQRSRPRPDFITNTNTETGGGDKKDQFSDIIRDLENESKKIQEQITLYGQKDAVINKNLRAMEIENKLAEKGVILTEQQKQQLDEYLVAIEKQTEIQKRLEEQERQRQQTISELGNAFQNAFDAAIQSGAKLSDVLKQLAYDVLNVARQSIKNNQSGTGFLGDILGGIFGGGAKFAQAGNVDFVPFPSYAVGTDYVPRDMIAQIHKGEKIIPAAEAAQMRRGGDKSGYTVNIDARGADAGVENKIRKVMMEVSALRGEVPKIAINSVADATRRNKGGL